MDGEVGKLQMAMIELGNVIEIRKVSVGRNNPLKKDKAD